MPGFNQRGPMNEGPMTGRGRGRCTDSADFEQGFPGRGNAAGMGRQYGRRGFQAQARGRGYGQWTPPVAGSGNQETLQDSVDRLEKELTAIKDQLKDLTEPGN